MTTARRGLKILCVSRDNCFVDYCNFCLLLEGGKLSICYLWQLLTLVCCHAAVKKNCSLKVHFRLIVRFLKVFVFLPFLQLLSSIPCSLLPNLLLQVNLQQRKKKCIPAANVKCQDTGVIIALESRQPNQGSQTFNYNAMEKIFFWTTILKC